MKHKGKAMQAALKLLLLVSVIFLSIAVVAGLFSPPVSMAIIVLWILFVIFTFYFFRDPTASAPAGDELIVSPAHGKVDVIDEIEEPQFMSGRCKRVSIFLSVVDVHVQKAPVSGKVASLKHTSGQFINALKADSALHNENVLIGFETSSGDKIGLRLIAGLLARRIIPWIESGETVQRGERVSLIQFGSRCNLYLPLNYEIKVKLGARVIGGESVIAERK